MMTQVRIQRRVKAVTTAGGAGTGAARATSAGAAMSPKRALRVRGPIDTALDVELFRALGDPTRAVLLACLAKCARPCSVGEVAECCRVDLSVVSRHLALMARAGLLEAKKEGRVVRYSVRFAFLTTAMRALADAIEECAGCGCAEAACAGGACAAGVAGAVKPVSRRSASGESTTMRRGRVGARRMRTGEQS